MPRVILMSQRRGSGSMLVAWISALDFWFIFSVSFFTYPPLSVPDFILGQKGISCDWHSIHLVWLHAVLFGDTGSMLSGLRSARETTVSVGSRITTLNRQ